MVILRSVSFAWKKYFFIVMLLVQKVLKLMKRRAGSYRHFVKDFSTLAIPLAEVVKKSVGSLRH